MVRHLYEPLFVQLAGTAAPAPGLPFKVWTDPVAGQDVTSQIVNPDNSPGYVAVTDTQGNLAPFRGPDGYKSALWADTGAAYRFMLQSSTAWDEALLELDTAAAQAAQALSATQNGTAVAVSWDAVSNKPLLYPPTDHTHTISQLNRSAGTPLSALILALLATSTAAEARTAIGAGTGNGSSNLTLGATADTAAPGNHTHDTRYYTKAEIDAKGTGTGSGGGGNTYTIFGATTARVDPRTGAALPAGSVVVWIADTKPTAMVDNVDRWFVASALTAS